MTVSAPDVPCNEPTCPIGDGLRRDTIGYGRRVVDGGSRYYSSRAGGPFRLLQDGADLLNEPSDSQNLLTDRQQVNLSCWIYQHNLNNDLFDELSNEVLQERGRFVRWMDDRRDRVPELDKAWVECHRDCTPSVEDRMLTFLRELIRSNNAREQPNEDLLMVAGGCRDDKDLSMLKRHVVEQGWTGSRDPQCSDASPYRINFSAHLYVDEQLRECDEDQQPAA